MSTSFEMGAIRRQSSLELTLSLSEVADLGFAPVPMDALGFSVYVNRVRGVD